MKDHTNRRRLRRAGLAAALAVGALAGATGGPGPTGAAPAPIATQVPPDDLRLNQIQVVGSHNSYHLAASPEETAVRRQFIGDADDALQYAHAPLAEQLAGQKVRQIELDIFRDDEGGLYSEPLLRDAAGHGPHDPVMDQPGTKVLHVQDVDYRSTCLTLVVCLQAVETWSSDNPSHLPIAILLELKDTEVGIGDFPFVVPEPWTGEAMDALDEEILSVVPRDEIITPDDVRGEAATLEDAVLSTGWPTLGESRGKVMFLMDNGGGHRTDYLEGHPALEDRVLFTNAPPGQDDAAFVKVNDARADEARIRDLVAEGYVVRTRSDAETVEAREGDTTGREAAFRSGAQWVSTDYPVAEHSRRFGTGYVVEIPGGTIARCNPVNGPVGCRSGTIEPFPEVTEGPYVDKLYRAFTGRASNDAERWFWGRRLAQGAGRSRVARALARSPEGRVGPLVSPIYDRLFGRAMAPADQAYWGEFLIRRPLDHMVIAALASPEFVGRSATPEGWITQVFQKTVRRDPSEADLSYFAGELGAGARLSTIVGRINGSVEARRLSVAGTLSTLLLRDATPGEITWLAEIQRTTRDGREVGVAIASTDEYHG